MIYGCVCDSAWEVGLEAGQTQEPEWFGPDCSLRHCPSGDDPVTLDDETDCSNVTSTSVYSGTAVSMYACIEDSATGLGVSSFCPPPGFSYKVFFHSGSRLYSCTLTIDGAGTDVFCFLQHREYDLAGEGFKFFFFSRCLLWYSSPPELLGPIL